MRDVFGDGDALIPGALRGYRAWGAVSTDGRLRSTGVRHFWRPDSAVEPELAQCLGGPCGGPAPGARCGCGLYGWYRPDDQRLVPGAVVGAVEASGRVQLGAHGFRAERVRVLGVWTRFPLFATLLDRAGHTVYDSLEQLHEALPPDDVSALIRHRCAGEDCARDSMHRRQLSSALMQLAAAAVGPARAAAPALVRAVQRR